MKIKASTAGFAHVALLLILVLAAVAGIGTLVYSRTRHAGSAPAAAAKVHRTHTITGAVVSTSLDAHGAATAPSSVFKATDAKLYVVATLQNAKPAELVAYTRYLNDKLVDNGSIKLSQGGNQNVAFDFSAKPGKTHPVGKYHVKLYVNGIYERYVDYTVQ